MAQRGRPRIQTGCNVPSCDRSHYGGGYCRPHYQRWKRTGQPGPAALQPRTPTGGPCQADGCDRTARTRGLCNGHYLRLRAHGHTGSPQVRTKAPKGSGSRWVDNHGYVILIVDGRRISEHRLVMEQQLGRWLFPGESVHHKNGVKTDNQPENLELWVSTQPAGQRVEDVLAWAKEIIARYG